MGKRTVISVKQLFVKRILPTLKYLNTYKLLLQNKEASFFNVFIRSIELSNLR